MQLTLYLMREGVKLDDDIIRDVSRFMPVAIQAPAAEDATWELYVNPGAPREPPWVSHVRPILTSNGLPVALWNRSTAAVLLIEAHERIFALTFGHGFQAIDSRLIQPGFGLRVTANSVASNRVVSADMHGYGKASRGRRVVLPAADELYLLGIEPNEEWVRKLSGKADAEFAARAVGADSLRLTLRDFSLRDLPGKLLEILERHDADDYKERYGFLDNLQQLTKDDPLVAELDKEVSNRLVDRDPDLGFAAPDLFEQQDVDHYIFKYRHREATCELLSTAEVFEALDAIGGQVENPLTQIHVSAFNDNGQRLGRRYDLHDYVQAEVIGDVSTRYVLSVGLWFRVSSGWVNEINNYVQTIEDLTNDLTLPEWTEGATDDSDSDTSGEGSYNRALAQHLGGILLDKQNVRGIGGRNQQIEICDVLTADRKLFCVKRATKSASLSHLFAQASVSASLMPEPKYQEVVMNYLQRLDASATYDSPTGWAFVYAIATDKSDSLAESLFFFSKVNLVTHARDIRSRGFNVALAKIEMR